VGRLGDGIRRGDDSSLHRPGVEALCLLLGRHQTVAISVVARDERKAGDADQEERD
jgi:hypothetical protein